MISTLAAAPCALFSSDPPGQWEVDQVIPIMTDIFGNRRSLCLEVPNSAIQNSTDENAILDVWRCDNFPPLGATKIDGRDKWILQGPPDARGGYELVSAVSAFNGSAPKCLTFNDFYPGSSTTGSVRARDCKTAAAKQAGTTKWLQNASSTSNGTLLVNEFSGLCLQVNVNKDGKCTISADRTPDPAPSC